MSYERTEASVSPGRLLPRRWGRRGQVEIHAASLPARTFTGDFYLTHRDDEGTWLVLGDVAGKGLRAAVTMAMIQEELEQRLVEEVLTRCDPGEAMLRLHSFLRPLLPDNRFATVVIGHLWDDGTLAIANAGHCAMLIARRDGSVEAFDPTGPVVGMLDCPRWSTVTTRLDRDEALLLYSDGLAEARSPEGDEFGEASIRRILSSSRAAHRPSACTILAEILAAFDRHSAGVLQDDLTVVVARRPGESETPTA
ncbi:MAG TPA: PP2C family protein-serine/threonine phosphatase [Candidatus Polarisedimenticolia bacterium]|nr:PP2C family protein-serine/threonine phosphatase [Candidatus Polarisedimenticolia bacterium]